MIDSDLIIDHEVPINTTTTITTNVAPNDHLNTLSSQQIDTEDLKIISKEIAISTANFVNYRNNKTTLPRINILTRSGTRKRSFQCLKQSILDQSYKNVRHIVSCDNPKCNFLQDEEIVFLKKPSNKGKCFYNLYLNQLSNHVKDGWVIILDDDSKLINKTFLLKLASKCSSTMTNKIIIYKAKINKRVIPRKRKVIRGKIDMCCFCIHHSVFKNFKFDNRCCGDFNFLNSILCSEKYCAIFCYKLPLGIHANYKGPKHGK